MPPVSSQQTPRVALLGAGPMARAYGHVLRELGADTVVVGRGEASAGAFRDEVGLDVLAGGLEANTQALAGCTHAVVALPVPALSGVSQRLVELGVPKLLVEKPAGLDAGEVDGLARAAKDRGADVFVAYNRRFYASVQEAKRRIAADGGATSFRFEISEWAERIAASPNTDAVKRAWFLANSTHVVDMAFFLGGAPATLHARVAGELAWHSPSVFAGCGESENGALFSYHGDWGAAPRWMVEICTPGHTYMFQPLEGLKVRTAQGFGVEEVELDDDADTRFKPGVLRQTEAFLAPEPSPDLLRIEDHARKVREVYAPMVHGTGQGTGRS